MLSTSSTIDDEGQLIALEEFDLYGCESNCFTYLNWLLQPLRDVFFAVWVEGTLLLEMRPGIS